VPAGCSRLAVSQDRTTSTAKGWPALTTCSAVATVNPPENTDRSQKDVLFALTE
jgi:hypothetical protein